MGTIGEKLGEARRNAGLSIEDVSHATRIHSNMILCIEEDDFSLFASVAYARGFIRNYAAFLNVEVADELDALSRGGTNRLGDNEFMREMKRTIQKDRRFQLKRWPKLRLRRSDRPGRTPVLLNAILATLIASLVLFYFLGYQAGSPEEAKIEILKGLGRANPFPPGENSEIADEPDELTKLQPNPLRPTPVLRAIPIVREGEEQSPAHEDGSSAVTARQPSALDRASTQSVATEAIEKPEVAWEIDSSEPPALARTGEPGKPNALQAAREAPEIDIDADDPQSGISIQAPDLPMVRRTSEEPTAILRPAGTSPPTPPLPETPSGDAFGGADS